MKKIFLSVVFLTQLYSYDFLFLHTNKSAVFSISLEKEFCKTHKNKNECKKDDVQTFTIHGLWIEPKNMQYCNLDKKTIGMDKNHQWNRLPDISLSLSTQKALQNAMAGYPSNLYKHEWYKHGTCSKMNPDTYFGKSIKYFDEFKKSYVAQLIEQKNGGSISFNEFKDAFEKSFGKNSALKAQMICERGYLSEIRVNLGDLKDTLSQSIANAKNAKRGCKVGKLAW